MLLIEYFPAYLDTPDKPKEADEWYKQALERARNIAKNIGQSSTTSKGQENNVCSPKSEKNAIVSSTYTPKQESHHELGKKIG